MHDLVSYRRFGRARSLCSDQALARARSLRSERAGRTLDRYVATEPGSSSVATQRTSRTDVRRYVATALWLELGRYVETEWDGRSVATQRPSLVATQRPSGTDSRTLRSDQAERMLGRYVATELGPGSVATQRPRCVHAWLPRIDRAQLVCGPNAILELVRGRFGYISVAYGQSYLVVRLRFEQDFTARLFVKISLRGLLFVKMFMLIFTDFQTLISS